MTRLASLLGPLPRLLACAATLIALTTALRAQTPPAPKPRIEFTTLAISGGVKGVFYDLGRERVSVSASSSNLSTRYTAPEGGTLQLYRLGPPAPPAEGPVKVPVATVPLTGKGPFLLLFANSGSNQISVRVVDNAWDGNPLHSSRVINAARRKIAVKLDSGAAELAPGEIKVFAPPAKETDIIELKIATLDEGGWNLRSLTPQPLYPYTRNTFVIKEQLPSPERPAPVDVDIIAVVDTSRPPVAKL